MDRDIEFSWSYPSIWDSYEGYSPSWMTDSDDYYEPLTNCGKSRHDWLEMPGRPDDN